MTTFSNSAKDGYVDADGFKGAKSSADIAAGRASTQPALFPNGLTSATGAITGTVITLPQIVSAHGTTQQSASTAVLPGRIVVSVCSTSTRGIRLSVTATGNEYIVYNDTALAVLVYPQTNCTIEASSTNISLKVAARKSAEFYCRNTNHIVTLVGA